MTDRETETDREAGGTVWDAPNQQVVRDDASPPWVEGSGGTEGTPVAQEKGLDDMTKAELLEEANRRDVDVPEYANKAEIREAIEQAD